MIDTGLSAASFASLVLYLINLDGIRTVKIIRKTALAEMLGLAITSLDDLRRRDPSFPRAVLLGARSVGFVETEVEAWIASRPRVGEQSVGAHE